jgi:hypothetical protein
MYEQYYHLVHYQRKRVSHAREVLLKGAKDLLHEQELFGMFHEKIYFLVYLQFLLQSAQKIYLHT